VQEAHHWEALATMPRVKHKVFAYITSGTYLLIFRHPDFPEAGRPLVDPAVLKGYHGRVCKVV